MFPICSYLFPLFFDQLFILYFVSKEGLTSYIVKRKTARALPYQLVDLKPPVTYILTSTSLNLMNPPGR